MISRTTHPNYDRPERAEQAVRKTIEEDPPAALLHAVYDLCGDDRCWCGGPAPMAAEPR